ncbi:hypothetical protein [Virgibacillus litoralis]|uniref:Uncharacterized protein n=1 Tax=Virgibacillus litoralis TaxID=578221 RepID=A0ABS4HB33_9BACI|nr:hypothetical protein [Virgibacillus litoralis]MBP1948116.1 hypothetical protein [Virgibacillus litoralis]
MSRQALINLQDIVRAKPSEGNTWRLLREKQQLKIPQEAFFASEEAEALPAESEVYFRSGIIALKLFK